jgi:hypothetical protein
MDKFKKWWSQPFTLDGDVTDWVLFTGFILIIIFMWTRVLRDITENISEV